MTIHTVTNRSAVVGSTVGYMSLGFEKRDGVATELVICLHPPRGDKSQKRKVFLSREETLNLVIYAKHVGLI